MYLSFCAGGIDDQTAAFPAIEHCLAGISHWKLHDKLKLNDDETEFLMIDLRQQLAKVSCDTINVGYVAIFSVSVSRGVWFDANLTMSTHIRKAFVMLGNRLFLNYLWSLFQS